MSESPFLYFEVMDTPEHEPGRCHYCGTYEPIASLVRLGDRDPFNGTGFGGEFELPVCADERECVRRRLHGVGR